MNKTLRGLFIGAVIGALCATIIIFSNALPTIFHQKWLERGSAYDVESESLYTNILRQAREVVNSPNSTVDKVLRDWQQSQVDKAFKVIPASDGERVIWQLWVDKEFWYKLHNKQDTPKTMIRALHYFDDLTTMPMASAWARDKERFEFANKFASYFLYNYQSANMSPEQVDLWRWKVARKMEDLSTQLEIKKFLAEKTSHKITPILWHHKIFMAANQLLVIQETKQIRCNAEAIHLLLESRNKLLELFPIYQSYSLDQTTQQSIQAITRDIEKDPENNLKKYCQTVS